MVFFIFLIHALYIKIIGSSPCLKYYLVKYFRIAEIVINYSKTFNVMTRVYDYHSIFLFSTREYHLCICACVHVKVIASSNVDEKIAYCFAFLACSLKIARCWFLVIIVQFSQYFGHSFAHFSSSLASLYKVWAKNVFKSMIISVKKMIISIYLPLKKNSIYLQANNF